MDSEWKPRYLFKIKRGYYLCLCTKKQNFSVETLKLFAGPALNMEEVSIIEVERTGTGKELIITTGIGNLVFPLESSLIKPSWQNNVINSVSTVAFRIHFRINSIRISRI